jgi:hypothetical protein
MLNLDLLGDDASTRFDVITSIVSAVEFVCTRNGASTYEFRIISRLCSSKSWSSSTEPKPLCCCALSSLIASVFISSPRWWWWSLWCSRPAEEEDPLAPEESQEIRVVDDPTPNRPFLAPSLEVEDLFDMKCSFNENWWLTPVHVEGGERLKNAIFVFFFFFSS